VAADPLRGASSTGPNPQNATNSWCAFTARITRSPGSPDNPISPHLMMIDPCRGRAAESKVAKPYYAQFSNHGAFQED